MTKGEFSMQSVKTLFKLDLKSRYGISQGDGRLKKLAQAGNMLFFVLVYAVLVVGIYYLSNVFVTRSGLRIEFLVIIATFTIALATIIATSTVIKNLYQNGDNEMLLRFPVSGKEILVAKSAYCYLHNLVTCLLTMLPFYISFGVVTNAGVGDYFAYIGIVLLSTFLPFFIANIIAVPVMKVMNLVKNQFLLVLIFTIIVVCAVFVFYLVSLSNVLEYLKDSKQTIFFQLVCGNHQRKEVRMLVHGTVRSPFPLHDSHQRRFRSGSVFRDHQRVLQNHLVRHRNAKSVLQKENQGRASSRVVRAFQT